MAKRHKYRNTKASDFFDYRENKLSPEDQNAFERQLQADPFEAEAAEGFDMLSRNESEKDLLDISRRINLRIKRKRRIAWYSAAAAIASMLIIGTIFINLSDQPAHKDEKLHQISKNAEHSFPATPKKENISISESEISERSKTTEPKQSENKELINASEKPAPIVQENRKVKKTAKQADALGKSQSEGQIESPAEIIMNQSDEILILDNELSADEIEIQNTQIPDPISEANAEENEMKEDNAFAWETMTEESTDGRYIAQKSKKERSTISPSSIQEQNISALDSEEMTVETLQGTVSGVVISSEDMTPLPGVSLFIKGTSQGTVTDFDGKFSLSTQDIEQGTVVASYIGMETEEQNFNSGTMLEIALNPDNVSLDEVVVVGYGISKTEDKTGSTSEIDMNDISAPEYQSPYPVTGMPKFKKYIDSTLIYPKGIETDDKEIVILKFRISSLGKPNNFQIIKSPSEDFSKEAIRAVSEGPDWNPANRNGEYVNETIRLRIVFKSSARED